MNKKDVLKENKLTKFINDILEIFWMILMKNKSKLNINFLILFAFFMAKTMIWDRSPNMLLIFSLMRLYVLIKNFKIMFVDV